MNMIAIDFDAIQKAMEDTARDAFDYFLDMQTGEIIILSEEIIRKARSILDESYDDDDIGDFEDVEVEAVPVIPQWMEDEIELALDIYIYEKDRYVRIPERNPQFGYNTMKLFAESLQDVTLGQNLLELLDGKSAFRRFKDSLAPYPKERKLWYGFNAKAARNEIGEWLRSIGIQQEQSAQS